MKNLRGVAQRLSQSIKRTAPLAAAVGLSTLFMTANAATADFTATYKGGSGSTCNTTYNIKGMEPAQAGKRPLFIYMVGTSEKYDNAQAVAAIKGMAERGYVAASIEYANGVYGRCSALTAKSKCIFNKLSLSSAVAALCIRAKADCSKGIVVGGFSQGSILGILSKNYDNRVQAVYGIGAYKTYAVFDTASCAANGKRVLSQNRLRVINGENDIYGGGSQSSVRDSSQVITGYNCTGTNCLQADGSGWRMALKSEVADGSADHCYMRANGCLSDQNVLDAGWATGAGEWALNANLDWLDKYTTK